VPDRLGVAGAQAARAPLDAPRLRAVRLELSPGPAGVVSRPFVAGWLHGAVA
jgi:hypothetical protein